MKNSLNIARALNENFQELEEEINSKAQALKESKPYIRRKDGSEELTKSELNDKYKEWREDNNWSEEEYSFNDYLRDIDESGEWELVESASDRYQVREFDGPGAKFGVYDTKEKKFIEKGSKKIMTAACDDMNKKLTESVPEEEKDETLIAIDNAEDMDELQDIIYRISDGALEDVLQSMYDDCVQDGDDLDVVKSLLSTIYEDNVELEESDVTEPDEIYSVTNESEGEELDKDHDAYLARMDKKLKTFCKNMELDINDLDDVLWAISELDGQFGDADGEYAELKSYIYNELLESAATDTGETDMKDESEECSKESLKEDEVIEISQTEPELDYIITDVTELEDVADGDVQSPDIDSLLVMLGESLKEEYNDAIKINILSSSLLENGSFALVDISTPQILKEFEEKNIYDAAVGKNLVLENDGDYYTFKVNSLNGTTRYSKRTKEPIKAIKEWIETEFLSEAKKEKEEQLAFMKAKTEKETVENYVKDRPELKMEMANIEMFIEMGKSIKDDGFTEMIRNRMYGLAAEFPNNIEVTNKDDKYELKFNNHDDIVEILFGKEWVKPVEEIPGNEIEGLKENEKADALIKDYFNHKISTLDELHNKLEKEFDTKKDAVEYFADNEARIKKTLKESYDQFNIGNIDVVYNPQTQECLYSIESADVHDKKINLSKIPSVEVPYDTDTIIKDYIEKQYGPIPEEVDEKEPEGEALPPVPTEEVVTDTEVVEEAEDDVPLPADMGIDSTPTEDAETAEESSAETGAAYFVKIRPGKQKSSVEDIRQQQKDGVVQQKSSYIVVEEVNLSEADFNSLSTDLSAPRDFLEGVQPLDRKNYAFNVVKVVSESAPYQILIDPTGFNYPRYVAIVDDIA